MKVNQLVTDYINQLYGDGKSKNTTKNYLSDLRFYQDWVDSNNINITEVNLQLLNEFKVYLRDYRQKNGKAYAQRTIARRVTAVKEFYNYLHDIGVLKSNPALKMTVPDIPKGQTPIYMKKGEIKALLGATQGETHGVRDRAILLVFLTTGLRLTELIELNKSDIDGNSITVLRGKGNKQRKVFLNSTCLIAVNMYLDTRKDNNIALFISERGNRISVSAINHMLKRSVKKAGIDSRISAHKIRHTAATTMLRNGVDIRVIQQILGHESLATTQQYTHVQDEDLQSAAMTMENIF